MTFEDIAENFVKSHSSVEGKSSPDEYVRKQIESAGADYDIFKEAVDFLSSTSFFNSVQIMRINEPANQRKQDSPNPLDNIAVLVKMNHPENFEDVELSVKKGLDNANLSYFTSLSNHGANKVGDHIMKFGFPDTKNYNNLGIHIVYN